jgi:hypothetical protein
VPPVAEAGVCGELAPLLLGGFLDQQHQAEPEKKQQEAVNSCSIFQRTTLKIGMMMAWRCVANTE